MALKLLYVASDMVKTTYNNTTNNRPVIICDTESDPVNGKLKPTCVSAILSIYYMKIVNIHFSYNYIHVLYLNYSLLVLNIVDPLLESVRSYEKGFRLLNENPAKGPC
jgi:hypothetical protein